MSVKEEYGECCCKRHKKHHKHHHKRHHRHHKDNKHQKGHHHFRVDENVAVTASTPPGYTPSQIRTAYGLNNITADGTGQTVAIIDAYSCPTIVSDFKKFDTQFGIGKPNNLQVVSLTSQTNQGWGLESSLDVQWVHAIAPGATILLIQARSSSLSDLITAINYAKTHGAHIISMSWGSNEFSTESLYDSTFTGSNIIFLASSGDVGGVVEWPSTAPNVVSVGGTTLTLNTNGSRISETGWSGSGGGISQYESLPTYQHLYGLTGRRQTPDTSMNGNPNTGVPVYDSFGYQGHTGWFQVGGTSLSVQTMAGVIAIANQLRANISKSPLSNTTFFNYFYNTLGKGANYSNDFYDITVGTAGHNTCKVGYDNVTGLGTPKNTSNVSGLIAGLVSL